MDYKKYFKGKRVTIMGLGLLGRGLNDAIFLANCGAELTVTDLKDKKALKPSLDKLKGFKNIKYTLGKHDLKDFQNKDFVLKSAGVPLDSTYISEARKNNIPVEMDASLFMKLMPGGVITIGVTGTRGKSTVTHLLSHILKNVGMKVYTAGNVRDMATLPLLQKMKEGDFVVMELDSWQLQGFGEVRISPHIAVFTNLMEDHKNYYHSTPLMTGEEVYFNDKANIFKFQKEEDVLVIGEKLENNLKFKNLKSIKKNANLKAIPENWKIKIPGEHNLENIACAVEAVKALGLSDEDIKKGVESFEGVEGRLQLVKNYNGISIYNDNNSTTPEATIVALKSLGLKAESLEKNIILIAGGADKGLELNELVQKINETCKAVILLPGTGSKKLQALSPKLQAKIVEVKNLKEAIKQGLKIADKSDILLFSPAFASFGMFKNEYDRGDKFIEIIKKIK